jgi:hypothetical protein
MLIGLVLMTDELVTSCQFKITHTLAHLESSLIISAISMAKSRRVIGALVPLCIVLMRRRDASEEPGLYPGH